MNISLRSDELIILSSGSVLTYSANSNIEFLINTEDEDTAFKVILKFNDDDNGKPYSKVRPNLEEKRIDITCYNFPKDASTREPLDLATINDKKLLLNFSIKRTSDKGGIRQIAYTFYEG